MEEFNELKKVQELFNSVNCTGTENNYFVAYKDMQKSNGMVSGMEYPYDALLINQTEKGIGMFFLIQGGIVLTQKLEKMKLDKESYIFIKNEKIDSVKIKKYAILNSKIKRICIDTEDKSYKLFAKLYEKDIPYQTENLSKFIEKYN